MSNTRYPEEFQIDAARQMTERALPVAARLGMSTHSLYA